ncbi:GNAT family N-acetyltransferase [Hamadaea sp. NPDC050747]|uniref:GNAT family N-acetyltransferase n=1 Tax=Hamadaea sp. NPDC050747 TaxID=3155789 RepID=UPI003409F694
MTDVEIRTAQEDDVPAVVAAYEWLFAPPGSPPPSWDPEVAADRVRHAIASDDSTVLIAVDSEVVGLCTAYVDILSVRFGRRCWVEDLATHPDRRSQGLGTLLLDAACSFARTRGATHIELDSGDARVRAHRFYEARTPSWTARSFGWVL